MEDVTLYFLLQISNFRESDKSKAAPTTLRAWGLWAMDCFKDDPYLHQVVELDRLIGITRRPAEQKEIDPNCGPPPTRWTPEMLYDTSEEQTRNLEACE